MATPLSPIYVKVAQFYVEREEDIPRILQGIMDAFNELAESVNMRRGGIIAILGDAEVAGDTAFRMLKDSQESAPEACAGDNRG